MDWNGDGLLDIIIGGRSGLVYYFRRTGSGVNDLTSEGCITANASDINVGASSAPVVVDWNNDGLLDLLVGSYYGYLGIRLYLNSGTIANPVFTTWSRIQSDGLDINRSRCCPQVYDMNGDGKKDLIMGELNAQIYYYENTGTDEAPVFSGDEAIQSNGSPIDLLGGTRLWVNDWDENGLPDLIVSDFEGYVYVFMADPTGIAEETTQTDFTISPEVNPARGNLNINIQAPQGGNTELRVYDLAGRFVVSKDVVLSQGANMIVIDTGSIAAGIYTVVATTGSDIITCRMILSN